MLTDLTHCTEYGPGTKAFYDAFVYMLKCTVLEVMVPGNGIFVTSGKLRIQIDEDTGPYKKGEQMVVSGYHTFPVDHYYSTPTGQARINGFYCWVPSEKATVKA